MAPADKEAPQDPEVPNVSVPAAFGCVGAGVAAIAFGAGYGARAYTSSVAYKELLAKFPEAPTLEAEALARTGAGRAFLMGTGLAGLMGVGAVLFARVNGIKSASDFGEATRAWLPTREQMEGTVTPQTETLQRTVTETLQRARDSAAGAFQGSSVGRTASERAKASTLKRPLEPWEVELMTKLGELDAPAGSAAGKAGKAAR